MKKSLAILLTAAMLLCAAPLAGFTAIDWPTLDLGKVFPASANAATIVDSGTCGKVDADAGLDGSEVTWTLYSDGLLTICGSGEMTDYENESDQPWYNYQRSISQLEVTDGVTYIGSRAFFNTTISDLYSITIANSVQDVGRYAFLGTYWEFDHPSGFAYIGRVLYEYIGKENLPENAAISIPTGTVAIGADAFSNAENLKSVIIPDTVQSIGDYAFDDCINLTSVQMGVGVNTIGVNAFARCNALTSIALGENVVTIGQCAFYGCENLISVELGDHVDSIEEGAFAECLRLTTINLPESLRKIGAGAFGYCVSLTEIRIPKNLQTLEIYISEMETDANPFFFTQSLQRVTVDPDNQWFTTDENGVLFDKAQTRLILFPSANSVEHYVVPESVTVISSTSFALSKSLKTCVLPDGLSEIGEYAFVGSGITTIRIPSQTGTIGEFAFGYCDALREIEVDDGNPSFSAVDSVLFTKDKKTLLLYPASKTGSLYAIPEGTEVIGNDAFCCEEIGLFSLEEHDFTLRDEVNSELEAIIFPEGITTIGNDVFWGQKKLKEINLPDSVTRIGGGAFEGCEGLTKIALSDNLAEIGNQVLYGCTGLTKITLPDSLQAVSQWAFANCTALTEVDFGDGVTEIGYCAFENCDSLASVFLPPSVTYIEAENTFPQYMVIRGFAGTYAQEWAEENGRVFISVGETFVTLNAPETVNEAAVNVYGVATPGAKVVCSVNGTAVKTVNAAASGKWSAALPLAGASDGDVFTVKASVTVDGETDEQTATVTYRPDAILFDELTMTHSYYSATVKAADLGKANRNFTYVPGQPFSFKIRVTNNDKIGKLYIVSTKGDDVKRMELTYDSASDYWFVTGQFDNNAKSYVPGVLTVEGVDKNGSPFHTGAEIRFNFLIDPSGYAYEAVQDNVLEGVTARVFYRDAEGHEILWNADAYDQLNPITTLADGAFAWVVPEGTWQVRLSKDGYEDAASEWMDVPPEYTDVYIPMISYMPPQVRNVFVYTDTAEIIFSQYMEIESVNAETVTFSGYTGTLTPVDAAETAPGSGVYYAKTFRFATDRTFARSVDVMIAGAVNYAGYEMEQPYTAHVQTGLEPADLKANPEIEAAYGETAEITVTAQYAAGRTVTVQANTANVSLSANTLTLDENGKATVTVTGEMPGFAILTFTLEGTALTATTAVTVPTPKTPENPVTPTDPTTPTDPDQPTEPDTPDEPTGEECPYCHKVHDNTFFGRILRVFHSIAYFFAHLFGTM